jgi:signal transduction histidine kinase/putative methionine-R-sulfoxide reductase with GAF domain
MPKTKTINKHLQELRRNSDLDSKSLLENIPMGVFRISADPSGEFMLSNSEFLKIFHLDSLDALLRIKMRDLFLIKDEWEDFYGDLQAKKQVSGLEVQLQEIGGSSFWASINARLIDAENSVADRWVDGTLEDISFRMLGEERNYSQMENLRQASLTLTASLDLREVLDTIAECALDLVPGMRNCHIFLYHSENGNKLIFGTALWGDGKRNQPFSNPRSNGLTMTVAKTGNPIMVPDLRSDPLYAGTPSSWSGSIIGLPLKIGDRVVGVMNVSHGQPGAFSESHIRMLRLLGDQAAIAIENARLYEAVATEERHLSLVYDIGRELAPSLDSNEILERAIGLTCQALGGSLGMALLYLPEEKKLHWQNVYQSDQQKRKDFNLPIDIDLETDIPGWVASNRKAINIPDITQDERFTEFPGLQNGAKSVLGAPIIHGEQLMGVICLYHDEAVAYSADQLELIQAICRQVGVALSNVGRYEQVQHLVEMLEREQERLSSLVERLPVGVLLLNESYDLVLVNSYGSEILALLGMEDSSSGLERLGPYSIEELIDRYNDPQPVEINLDGSKPKIFEIETRALGGEYPHWILMIRDITIERYNQSRIQMQDRLATVGQLAAGIAHDFNNIMATILVYSDLLLKDLALNPTGLERLSIIQQQVQRASSLIRQILDFSRQSVMEQSTLDLLPFIKEFDRLLERVLPETIRVELNFQPGSYPVHADPTRLQQVLMNLAINARDAMPEGGTLSFNLNRLALQPGEIPPSPYLPNGEWLSITVGDTGMGIPPEVIPHIFEPFFSTKPIGEGTGLGLAQAYGIIKQHGGYIDVHSNIGEGTRFSIYLPTLPAEQIDINPVEYSSPLQGLGQTILVVEDDPTTLNAIQDLLEAQEYRVLVASNGNEAMQILELNLGAIDLLVSDMVMPEMGGLALYNQVKEKWPQVKIIFVTGHPMGGESKSLLEEKQITWLHKPFSVPEFFATVEDLLASG